MRKTSFIADRLSGLFGVLMMIVVSGCVSDPQRESKSVEPSMREIRIVGMEEPVQSRKRGVCANMLKPEDFRALAPGVSWYYNWHFKGPSAPEGVALEFVPMVWGDTPERLDGLRTFLKENPRPRAVLVNNEPNLKGQAFISPEQSADLHRRVEEITRPYDLPLIGPHMAIGSAPGASITAFDPIQQKEVTYTFMMPFLKAFFHFLGDVRVDGTAVHSYKREGEVKWAVDLMYREFQRPVWMTEYAWWAAPDERESMRYMVKATDWMERSDKVEAYAWFKERIGRAPLRLLKDEPGQLTDLGRAYVRMPVHDPAIHYATPGRLCAGRYVEARGAEIDLSDDPNHFLLMRATRALAEVDYQIFVRKADRYRVTLHVGGTLGRVTVLSNGAELGSAVVESSSDDAKGSGALIVDLPAGASRLTIRFAEAGQWINGVSLESAERVRKGN